MPVWNTNLIHQSAPRTRHSLTNGHAPFTFLTWCLALILLGAAGFAFASDAAPHDRAFWQSIIDHDYAVPADQSLPDLTRELTGLLGSPDPDLRDEVAYSILAGWIYQKRTIEPAALRPLVATLTANLTADIGSAGTDAVLKRSFSALVLSVVAARDNAASFLTEAEYRDLLDRAIAYLGAERDVRGYDEEKGWMHSAAHTADLLKFLGRNRYLRPADQARVLDAVSSKLRGAPVVFTHGEDERMARAVLSLVARGDFDPAAFGAWVDRAVPPRLTTPRPASADLRARQNITNLLAKLEVLLTLQDGAPESTVTARDRLRRALKSSY
jgi:hypothetical protein